MCTLTYIECVSQERREDNWKLPKTNELLTYVRTYVGLSSSRLSRDELLALHVCMRVWEVSMLLTSCLILINFLGSTLVVIKGYLSFLNVL